MQAEIRVEKYLPQGGGPSSGLAASNDIFSKRNTPPSPPQMIKVEATRCYAYQSDSLC